MNKKEKFITKANRIHNNKYDYININYVNSSTKVSIVCPIHGNFLITPENHIQKQGCKECGLISRTNKRKKPLNKFILQANLLHNNKYDYSKVEYINSNEEIIILCPIHGEYRQIPHVHLSGHGCKKCSGKIKSLRGLSNVANFINKAKKVHNDKYDYSKVEYAGSQKYVKIICPTHGEFIQYPNSHLKGRGCSLCSEKIKGGWTSYKWLVKAKSSTKFDSFKLYFIECWDENERFIKIGRTFKTIQNRFDTKIPYKYKVLKTIIYDDYKECFYDEIKLKQLFKKYTYKPQLKFGGSSECFNLNQKDNILISCNN